MDWNRWKNFNEDEFRCRHCGRCDMSPEFLDILQAIRTEFGKPMPVSSGDRCAVHNSAVSSTGAHGPHTTGKAADIHVTGADALRLVEIALKHGVTGVGVAQKGTHGSRFIHLDTLEAGRPAIWSY